AQVDAGLELPGPLRLELPGLGRVAEQTAGPVLGRGKRAAPVVDIRAAAQEGERREIWLWLGADLAVGRAELAVAEDAALADGFGELPGPAGAGEPGVLRADPKAGCSVVPEAALEEELVPDIKGRLPEVSRNPQLRFVIDRR